MASSAKVAHDISNDNIIRTQDIEISENVDFKGMYLSERVLKGLENSGFLRPSPIQLKSIPLGRCGLDLIVQAKAGTGKTCVFTVVALEGLQVESPATQVLVLAPTREIAFQIWQVITSIGSGTKGLTCATFIGGISVTDDKENLRQCHIAVGTPGRIKFLIEQNYLKTKSIRLFVLDEADQLLDECFQADINWIYSVLPENKQILALSATYPEFMMRHLLYYMRNPTYIRLDVTQLALLGIKQYYLKIPFHPHVQKAAEYSDEAAIKILSSVSFNQCLIFSNLQSGAQSLAYKLEEQGWPTCCIAGSLEQKERNEAMASLKSFQCRVLISTDLTSRGIDAENVNLVINLDLPRKPRVYLHRIGRAGRFGSQGAAISLVPGDAGMRMLKKIQTVCNTTLKPLPNPIPHDLVTLPCEKRCIKLDDIVHTKTLSTAELLKGKDITKEFTRNSTSKALTRATEDSSTQKIPTENSITVAENGTCEPDKSNDDSDTSVADLPLSKSSKKSNFSKTSSKSDFPKVKNSGASIKNTEMRNSLDSKIIAPKLFNPSKLLYNQELVNQLSVSPWKPTEVPGFKPVPSPGSYSDLCSEFELFTCKDDKEACDEEEGDAFQSVLPVSSKSDLSLKGGVCKTLDAYYKNVCRGLSSDASQEMLHASLQVSSVEMVNNAISKSDQQDCADSAVKTTKKVPSKIEAQLLFPDIKQESLNVGIKDDLKLKPKQNPNENASLSLPGLKENLLSNKEAKKYYRHLFRREEEEYFVPDYLPYQVDDEKSQPEKSQSKTAAKKASRKSFPQQQDEKSKKLPADKGPTKKPNVAAKDENDKVLKDKTQSPSLTALGGNTKYAQKRSEHQTLDDDDDDEDSSSESEEFSDSSASDSVSESSSYFSESDSDSSTESSSEEEERTDYPCGYPLMYSQYPHPYPWNEGYPMRAPMNPNPYGTCPNYYYGYPVPFTQPGPGPKVTPDLYPTMQSLSNHHYQQQQNYIKWMTKSYLTRKQ